MADDRGGNDRKHRISSDFILALLNNHRIVLSPRYVDVLSTLIGMCCAFVSGDVLYMRVYCINTLVLIGGIFGP